MLAACASMATNVRSLLSGSLHRICYQGNVVADYRMRYQGFPVCHDDDDDDDDDDG